MLTVLLEYTWNADCSIGVYLLFSDIQFNMQVRIFSILKIIIPDTYYAKIMRHNRQGTKFQMLYSTIYKYKRDIDRTGHGGLRQSRLVEFGLASSY